MLGRNVDQGKEGKPHERWLAVRTALDLFHRRSEREPDKVVARRVEQVAAVGGGTGQVVLTISSGTRGCTARMREEFC